MKQQLLILVALACMQGGMAQDAAAIIQKADARMRGNTARIEMTIRIIRPTWSRSLDIKAWSKGKAYSLILIQGPAKDRGIVYLKRNKEVWNWIPALERNIKLPPSMMSQSWMGTDFNNDDLVRESSVTDDYTHRLLGDTLVGNRLCYQIEMIPRPDAAVVWSRLLVCIDKKDFLELHTRFYDENGQLVQVMNGYDIQLMDGRLLPSRFEMIPADKKGYRTEMHYRSVQFDRPITDDFFSTSIMKSALTLN